MTETRNILLIGRTNNGKSTLENVLSKRKEEMMVIDYQSKLKLIRKKERYILFQYVR